MKTTKNIVHLLLCALLLAVGSAGADPSTGHGPGLKPSDSPPPTSCTTLCGN